MSVQQLSLHNPGIWWMQSWLTLAEKLQHVKRRWSFTRYSMLMDMLLDVFGVADVHTSNAALFVESRTCFLMCLQLHLCVPAMLPFMWLFLAAIQIMAQVDFKSDLLLQHHRLRSEASWLSNLDLALFLTW